MQTSSSSPARAWLVTVVILTVMITPIMIALICEALASVPSSWREGAIALGLQPAAGDARRHAARGPPGDRRRRRARDRARARRGDHDLDGLGRAPSRRSRATASIFLFEPLRTLASAIIDYHEGIGAPALRSTLYAFALLLLFSGVRAVGAPAT